MYTILELLSLIPSIEYDQRIFFTDPNYQQWYLELEESYEQVRDLQLVLTILDCLPK